MWNWSNFTSHWDSCQGKGKESFDIFVVFPSGGMMPSEAKSGALISKCFIADL